MKKLFISQPMRGKTEEQILAERQDAIIKAKDLLKAKGIDDEIEVIDSYFENYNPTQGCIPLQYLAKSLDLLAHADIAYFANGWKDARGCKIEHDCAIAYGIAWIYGNEIL